ncbi:MAG: hypothetical protein MPJ50_05935 [Pirellulales bacterium]|nr:hypothetical protein [Pirellulales bacterium]
MQFAVVLQLDAVGSGQHTPDRKYTAGQKSISGLVAIKATIETRYRKLCGTRSVASQFGPPCVRATASGPLIHAPAASSETEWLPIAEPVQMRSGFEVKEISNVLTYSFALCLPPGIFDRISRTTVTQLPEFLEEIERPLFELPDAALPQLPELLPLLLERIIDLRLRISAAIRPAQPEFDFDFDFSLPEIGPPTRFPCCKAKAITLPLVGKLSSIEFHLVRLLTACRCLSIECLPTGWAGWGGRFRDGYHPVLPLRTVAKMCAALLARRTDLNDEHSGDFSRGQ